MNVGYRFVLLLLHFVFTIILYKFAVCFWCVFMDLAVHLTKTFLFIGVTHKYNGHYMLTYCNFQTLNSCHFIFFSFPYLLHSLSLSAIFPLIHVHFIFISWSCFHFPINCRWLKALRIWWVKKYTHTHTHAYTKIEQGLELAMPIIQLNCTMMVYRFSSGWHARFWNI